MVRDPICGMMVDDQDRLVLRAQVEKSDYFFCSEACRTKFLARHDRA